MNGVCDLLREIDRHAFDHDLAGADRFYAKMAETAPGIYKAAALQLESEALYGQGDAKGALAKLDAAAAATHDKFLADAARLKAAYIAADLQDYKTVKPRLDALIKDSGPLSYEAREVLGAKAYEAGDLAQAREQFNFLSLALEAPEGVRRRAQSALSVIGSGEAQAPAKPGVAK